MAELRPAGPEPIRGRFVSDPVTLDRLTALLRRHPDVADVTVDGIYDRRSGSERWDLTINLKGPL